MSVCIRHPTELCEEMRSLISRAKKDGTLGQNDLERLYQLGDWFDNQTDFINSER